MSLEVMFGCVGTDGCSPPGLLTTLPDKNYLTEIFNECKHVDSIRLGWSDGYVFEYRRVGVEADQGHPQRYGPAFADGRWENE